MHFCTAYVQIGGDRDNTVYRDAFNPVSWPEVEVIRQLHGDESVHTVTPFVWVPQAPREERVRLVLKYGRENVEAAFGQGRGDKIDVDAPEATLAHGARWKNPLTQLEETVLEAETEPPPSKQRNAKGVFVKQPEVTI
jgi:hypothetical protein